VGVTNRIEGESESIQRDRDWRSWMRELGKSIRTAREALGLSQSELAVAAGVSQGAISRLETGRGLATPLLVVLKTAMAIRDAEQRLGLPPLRTEAAPLVESLARHVGPSGSFERSGMMSDPAALELLAAYRALPSASRERLLEVVRTSVAEGTIAAR